ncbi:MAG TPA: peptide deformylase [Candidatus Paceibacterota bacterium]|nr:peptide deformylase [Candidatus Paceibacterota bacterium]
MIIEQVTQIGHKTIRSRSQEISNLKAKSVQQVVTDLIDSMRHHELVGMAAPQIGKKIRIFVTEIRETKLRKGQNKKNIDPLRVFINPRIVSLAKVQESGWEGCGSVAEAGIFGMVKRPISLAIEAFDRDGNKFRLEADSLLARVIQHEMDHLNGVVFIDKADTGTFMSRNEYLKIKSKRSKKSIPARRRG